MTDIRTYNGAEFHVEVVDDSDIGPPWENCDGHWPITKLLSRDKRPGEWVLYEVGSLKRFYDAQEAQKIALRDGWGVANPEPGMTRRQIAAAAVRKDYERLRAWCNDEWNYVYVTVQYVDADEGEIVSRCIGGYESDDDAGIEGYIKDAMEEMYPEVVAHRLGVDT